MKSWACGSCANVVPGKFRAAYSREAFTADWLERMESSQRPSIE